MLSDAQIERYSRQIILPHVGGRGQERLLSASVAVCGAGGIGSAAALYLAAAGVGAITILDAEAVRDKDLRTGVLHTPMQRGSNRAASAAAELATLNPDCRITPLAVRVTADAASETARAHRVVVAAGCDQEATTLLNAACLACRTPLVWGWASDFIGQATTFAAHEPAAPCYRCLHADAPATEETNAYGIAAGFVGTLLATESIKLILGLPGTLIGRLVVYDALAGDVREAPVVRDPQCTGCSSAKHSASLMGNA